jgi:hypothetical protein
MNQLNRKRLFQAFLKHAQQAGDKEAEQLFAKAIKTCDAEIDALDLEAHRAASKGAALARFAQGRDDQPEAVKLYDAVKGIYLSAKKPVDRTAALDLMRTMAPELPFSVAQDLERIIAREGTEEGRLAREGAALARSIQPRRGQ